MAQNPPRPVIREQWFVGAPLGDHPVMSELARFHAGFAMMEVSLNVLMTFVLGKPRPVVEAIMFRIRNIADRVAIIGSVANASEDLTSRQKLSVEIACAKAIALNARRNVYAHALYEHRGDKIRLTPYALAANSRQREVLKLDRVKKDVASIDELITMTLLYAGHVPEDTLSALLASP